MCAGGFQEEGVPTMRSSGRSLIAREGESEREEADGGRRAAGEPDAVPVVRLDAAHIRRQENVAQASGEIGAEDGARAED